MQYAPLSRKPLRSHQPQRSRKPHRSHQPHKSQGCPAPGSEAGRGEGSAGAATSGGPVVRLAGDMLRAGCSLDAPLARRPASLDPSSALAEPAPGDGSRWLCPGQEWRPWGVLTPVPCEPLRAWAWAHASAVAPLFSSDHFLRGFGITTRVSPPETLPRGEGHPPLAQGSLRA